MSRTYRNRRYRQYFSGASDESILTEYWVSEFDETQVSKVEVHPFWYGDNNYKIVYRKDSKEGKKRLAKYFSDNGTHKFKEPGPSWFRNLHCTRPYRRKVKNELRKFLLDEEYEIDYNEPYVPYWT